MASRQLTELTDTASTGKVNPCGLPLLAIDARVRGSHIAVRELNFKDERWQRRKKNKVRPPFGGFGCALFCWVLFGIYCGGNDVK
jgi:hypothetical protein